MYIHSDELFEMHREQERAHDKLDLRIERLEDFIKSQRGQIETRPGDFAKRADFERHLDAFDELTAIVKRLDMKVRKCLEGIELLMDDGSDLHAD